jgi:hypothetical protein
VCVCVTLLLLEMNDTSLAGGSGVWAHMAGLLVISWGVLGGRPRIETHHACLRILTFIVIRFVYFTFHVQSPGKKKGTKPVPASAKHLSASKHARVQKYTRPNVEKVRGCRHLLYLHIKMNRRRLSVQARKRKMAPHRSINAEPYTQGRPFFSTQIPCHPCHQLTLVPSHIS